MSWEDEDWESKDIATTKEAPKAWDDEDAEEEEEEDNVPKSAPINPDKKKPIGKIAEEKEKAKGAPVSSNEKLSAKQKEQMAKDSDYQNATGLFSGLENAIDVNNPKDKRDFEVLAATVAEKLAVHQKNPFYSDLCKELITKVAGSVKPEDLIQLSKVLSNMAHDKQKAEKAKKAPVKKATLNVKAKDPFEGLDDRAAVDDDYDDGGLMS